MGKQLHKVEEDLNFFYGDTKATFWQPIHFTVGLLKKKKIYIITLYTKNIIEEKNFIVIEEVIIRILIDIIIKIIIIALMNIIKIKGFLIIIIITVVLLVIGHSMVS